MVAIRALARLRQDVSLQSIRSAFATLSLFEMTEHPSMYQFGVLNKQIHVRLADGEAMNLAKLPGQITLFSFADLFEPFTNSKGVQVVNFLHPRPHLSVNPRRIGGWPTAGETRVPYDAVANLMATGEVTSKDVSRFFPSVTASAARDAASFDRQVRSIA